MRKRNSKVIYSGCGWDLTLRELLFSIAILLTMLALGFFISEKIGSANDEANQEYYQAMKIDGDSELFQYGMRTSVGNAFVSGTLEAVNPVSYQDIDGEYAYIEKIKERYTKHTRTVTHSDGKETYTTVETYYTWDRVGSEDIHCGSIRFLGVDFPYEAIPLPSADYIDTVKTSSSVRYKYYGCATSYEGTIYADLRGGTISKALFINGKDTVGALEYMVDSGNAALVAFWIFWIALIGAALYGFYYMDNRWLEDE